MIFASLNNDAFVRSRNTSYFVNRRKPVSSLFNNFNNHWTPVFTGETIFYEFINNAPFDKGYVVQKDVLRIPKELFNSDAAI